MTACLQVVKSVLRSTVLLGFKKGVSAVTCASCCAGVTPVGQADWTAVVRCGN